MDERYPDRAWVKDRGGGGTEEGGGGGQRRGGDRGWGGNRVWKPVQSESQRASNQWADHDPPSPPMINGEYNDSIWSDGMKRQHTTISIPLPPLPEHTCNATPNISLPGLSIKSSRRYDKERHPFILRTMMYIPPPSLPPPTPRAGGGGAVSLQDRT